MAAQEPPNHEGGRVTHTRHQWRSNLLLQFWTMTRSAVFATRIEVTVEKQYAVGKRGVPIENLNNAPEHIPPDKSTKLIAETIIVRVITAPRTSTYLSYCYVDGDSRVLLLQRSGSHVECAVWHKLRLWQRATQKWVAFFRLTNWRRASICIQSNTLSYSGESTRQRTLIELIERSFCLDYGMIELSQLRLPT